MNIIENNAIELYNSKGVIKWIQKLSKDEPITLFVREITEDKYFRIVGMYDDIAINGEKQLVIECVDIDDMFNGVNWAKYLHDEIYEERE